MQIKKLLILFITLQIQSIWASCNILDSSGKPVSNLSDPVMQLVDAHCPRDVFALRRLLKSDGLTLETTMVANRGFHNPSLGSFSIFEIVSGKTIKPGDFFFGHFTTVDENNHLIADQTPDKGSLMIETFAWDNKKQVYNFYELRGDGQQGQWFYRGDSNDIFADITLLHRQPDPAHPQFGTRLRCSGCHSSGGPIMKELTEPHNDWWEPNKKLDFGNREFDAALSDILTTLVPADHLADAVKTGLTKLYQSPICYKHVSLQEQLRPLFCPVEVNLSSDSISNDDNNSIIQIPAEFFVDKRLLSATIPQYVPITRTQYEAALKNVNSHFPETPLSDANHAWLTPVKAKSDKIAVDRLLSDGIIDKKFAANVLGVDITNPVFSSARCHLLQYIPHDYTDHWQQIFMTNLSKSNDNNAKQLSLNLADPNKTVEYYEKQVDSYLTQCKTKLQDSKNIEKLLALLIQRRVEIKASEISKNPKGQILEPGFRVIFPETDTTPTPEKLSLNVDCDVI